MFCEIYFQREFEKKLCIIFIPSIAASKDDVDLVETAISIEGDLEIPIEVECSGTVYCILILIVPRNVLLSGVHNDVNTSYRIFR